MGCTGELCDRSCIAGVELRAVGVELLHRFQSLETLIADVNNVNACFPYGFIFTFVCWRKGSLNDFFLLGGGRHADWLIKLKRSFIKIIVETCLYLLAHSIYILCKYRISNTGQNNFHNLQIGFHNLQIS